MRTPSPPPWEGQAKTLQSPTNPLSASAVWDCNCHGPGHLSQGSFQSEAKPRSYRHQGHWGMGRLDGASYRTMLSAGRPGMPLLRFYLSRLLKNVLAPCPNTSVSLS